MSYYTTVYSVSFLSWTLGLLMTIKTKEYKGLLVYELLNDFQDQWFFPPLQEGFSGIQLSLVYGNLAKLYCLPHILCFSHLHPFNTFFVMYLIKFSRLLKFLKALGLCIVNINTPF